MWHLPRGVPREINQTAGSQRRNSMRRLLLALAGLAFIGAAGFLIATDPAFFRLLRGSSPVAPPARPILPMGGRCFCRGCASCHATPGQSDRLKLGAGFPCTRLSARSMCPTCRRTRATALAAGRPTSSSSRCARASRRMAAIITRLSPTPRSSAWAARTSRISSPTSSRWHPWRPRSGA